MNKRNNNHRFRRLAYWAIGLLLAAGVLWIIFGPETVSVETATVVEGPMQVTVNNQGQVRMRDRYVVTAPVAAELQRIALRQGDAVRRGQTVALLDPVPLDLRQRQETVARLESARAIAREAAARVQRANAETELATSELERTRRLVDDGFVSAQAAEKAAIAARSARAELDAARLRHQAAQADVRAAEAALAAADAPPGRERQIPLTAPVDGYVVQLEERSGRTVAAGTPLVTIGDPSRYEIVVDVLSTDAVRIPEHAPMLLEGWGGGRTLRAQVRLVEPVAFTKISALGVEEQRVNVVADPVDQLGPLGDGYRIEARIVIWAADQVLKVPGSSLFRVGERWRVFVLREGRLREQEVEVGRRNQDEAQVLSGLQAGDVVVRFPSNDLRDGMRAEPRTRT
ncbi:MAG TPA: efflux RND transporter periplasmic adaptor subunit [Noviherbaspirillum sp.]|nr:efflux RND transporter periplasmic adaptor subunit [Noviherbaspirillum sp.]